MASGPFNSSRQLGGRVSLTALATIAALRTGPATDPAALNDGYALGLSATAGLLFALAAIVAIGVLPRRQAALPDPQPAVPTKNRLEGTPSRRRPATTCSPPRCSSAPTAMSEPSNDG
ncbi:hypothetical protein [Streptomyces sp. 35G-GA-8]|uniref:hypothetical protein n=1 Tax=Streptomyces sp. 35G-GA-8 TaxID=2939434 RepID=UPI0035AE30DA